MWVMIDKGFYQNSLCNCSKKFKKKENRIGVFCHEMFANNLKKML